MKLRVRLRDDRGFNPANIGGSFGAQHLQTSQGPVMVDLSPYIFNMGRGPIITSPTDRPGPRDAPVPATAF